MAYVHNHPSFPSGVTYTTTSESVYYLKELLKTAGWTVTSSGTGSGGSYAASDQFATPASLNANFAWFAIQDPSGASGRAWCFQRSNSSDGSWRLKYASTGGFTGGTPDHDTTPAATTAGEEHVLIGGGTDASPTFAGLGPASGSSVAYMVADNAAPYGFCMYAKNVGVANNVSILFMDPLVSGTYTNTDTDPVVIGAAASFIGNHFYNSISGTARAWIRKASGTGAVLLVGYAQPIGWGGSVLGKAGGTDPESSEDVTYPLIWGRHPSLGGSNVGWKGISSLFDGMLSNRAIGDTLSRSTTRDRIVITTAEWTMPWNGTVPTV